jgi:uncharacterized protein
LHKALSLLILFLALNNCYSQIVIENSELKNLPEIINYVNDFEGILSIEDEIIIKNAVESFDRRTKNKIIIVTVDSIEPFENIFDYSLTLANKIKFNTAVLIVVSKNLSQIQIQNNESVLEKLTNEETKSIIENYIIPEFKNNNYYKGLIKGIAEIKKELE